MDILKNLAPNKGVIVIGKVSDGSSLRVSGEFLISRGGYSKVVNFWGDADNSSYDKYFTLCDLDYSTNENECKIGEIPIDDVNKFRNGLRDHGMTTLADSFDFTSDEVREAIYKALNTMPDVIKFFGKGYKCLESLSENERRLLYLDDVIARFDKISDYSKKDFGIPYDTETQNHPTIEELKAYRETIAKL